MPFYWRNLTCGVGRLILVSGLLVSCGKNSEPNVPEEKTGTGPNDSTIAYMGKLADTGYHLRISYFPYEESGQITPSFATMPDWSPDKRLIAYTDGRFRICTVQPDGNNERKITPTSLTSQAARFSPDSRKLVFLVTKPDTSGYDIWTAFVDGTSLRHVVIDRAISQTGVYSYLWPDWSPDGTKIIFTYWRVDTTEYVNHLAAFDLNTQKLDRILIPSELIPIEPRWSPDGQDLLVTCGYHISETQGGMDIWRVHLRDQSVMRLTYGGRCRSPDFNRSGDSFLYEEIESTTRRIWMMHLDGTEKQKVTIAGELFGSCPTW